MELLGVGLGITVAILWGSADIFATFAARRLRPFNTALISQSTGLLALLVFGTIVFWHFPFTLKNLTLSGIYGIFTGLCSALATFALYRALEIGPIALVGPMTATSSAFTLVLSAFILKEHLTTQHKGLVVLIILGIVLASTNFTELRKLFKKKPGYLLWSQGARWAVVATLAYGTLDFGIGASASVSGWLLPVLWTRFFSILFLTLIFCGNRLYQLFRPQDISKKETSKLSLSGPKDIAYLQRLFSIVGSGILLVLFVGTLESAVALSYSLWSQEVRLAAVATLAFGALYFGIRASASFSDWLLPILWTRFFSPLFLTLSQLFRSTKKTSSQALLSPKDIEHLRHPFSTISAGILLALFAGILEIGAGLSFSFDTRIATTGVTSAIASSYALVVLIFGIISYRERLTKTQFFGIAIFMMSVSLLTL